MDRREWLFEAEFDRYIAFLGVLLNYSDNLMKYVGNVDILLVERLLLEEGTNMSHRLVPRTGVSENTPNRRVLLRRIRRSGMQPSLRRLCIGKDRHQGLVQFVSDRARKFGDGRQPRSLRELDSRITKVVFRSFPLIDIN